ncbi:DM13 domain-containing protein [Candidatus Pacearchaeota archaeon]|nr:DM13 domain-containing protein [Candidatus Pacearchaeota archaeon]
MLFLYLAWYLLSPLFIDKVVSEESPFVESRSVSSGSFMDADSSHKVSGVANVISDNENYLLRFEDFESTNGPDLKVYLSEDLDANSYVSLGVLKGNIGNQNYEIPPGTDLNKYKYALIWCERFSVLFGSAELSLQ